MIHMATTGLLPLGRAVAECRCGWVSDPEPSREAARQAGDAHLASYIGRCECGHPHSDHRPSPLGPVCRPSWRRDCTWVSYTEMAL